MTSTYGMSSAVVAPLLLHLSTTLRTHAEQRGCFHLFRLPVRNHAVLVDRMTEKTSGGLTIEQWIGCV